MNATERFIRDAIEGGWAEKRSRVIWKNPRITVELPDIQVHEGNVTFYSTTEKVMLDPAAWQAVGKVRSWDNKFATSSGRIVPVYPGQENQVRPLWLHKMHGLIDALCDGKSIEEYLAAIEK